MYSYFMRYGKLFIQFNDGRSALVDTVHLHQGMVSTHHLVMEDGTIMQLPVRFAPGCLVQSLLERTGADTSWLENIHRRIRREQRLGL